MSVRTEVKTSVSFSAVMLNNESGLETTKSVSGGDCSPLVCATMRAKPVSFAVACPVAGSMFTTFEVSAC